jgi:hypothetical protein
VNTKLRKILISLKVQDSLLECVKTYEKTVQFVYEYMCIVHEKAAALPGIHNSLWSCLLRRFHSSVNHPEK